MEARELGSRARDGGQGPEGGAARSQLVASRASSSATVEELYLLGKLTRALGSANIDHRLRQSDFRDQAGDPAAPGLGGLAIAAIDQLDALLVVGCNLRREAPCSRIACARPPSAARRSRS